MKVSVVIPVLNGYSIFAQTLNLVAVNSNDVEIVVIDNASDEGGKTLSEAFGVGIGVNMLALQGKEVKIVRNEENSGNYPIFNQALSHATGDILAFIHSDLFIHEKSWDDRVRKAFEADKRLGLIGFIGSNEIDNWGGRGLGTMSNFQGKKLSKWQGSPAEPHGARVMDLRRAVVVDGCSMVFKREALVGIGYDENFPPHHFYDRLMSCQILEKGWKVGVLGIAVDHISGQTANCQVKYHEAVKKWFAKKGITEFQQWRNIFEDWIRHGVHPKITDSSPSNYDQLCYLEAERLFLTKWRDEKKFIPRTV